MRGHFIWNLWNSPKACFINFVWNDHSCKILYFCVTDSRSHYGCLLIPDCNWILRFDGIRTSVHRSTSYYTNHSADWPFSVWSRVRSCITAMVDSFNVSFSVFCCFFCNLHVRERAIIIWHTISFELCMSLGMPVHTYSAILYWLKKVLTTF